MGRSDYERVLPNSVGYAASRLATRGVASLTSRNTAAIRSSGMIFDGRRQSLLSASSGNELTQAGLRSIGNDHAQVADW